MEHNRIRSLLDHDWSDGWSCPDLSTIEPGPARIRHVAATDYPVLAVPEQFGGAGFDLCSTASAQRELAIADPATAIALNMHTHTIAILTEYWKVHSDYSWFLLEGIAETHGLLASAFSEPGGSVNFLRAKTVARRSERGFRVSGAKFPCSLVSTARLFCLSASLEGTGESIVALCPAGSDGLSSDTDAWSPVGMQASDTGKLQLEDVEIDRRLVFYQAPADDVDELVVAGIVCFAVLISATYHGVLSRLVELAAAGATARDVTVAERVGAAVRELLMMQFATNHLARAWDAGSIRGQAALVMAMALRSELSAVRDRVVSAITPVVGSRIFSARDEISGRALDSLAVHHHPPSLRVCDLTVGSFAAGAPFTLDPQT